MVSPFCSEKCSVRTRSQNHSVPSLSPEHELAHKLLRFS